jgi:hypothetical protein
MPVRTRRRRLVGAMRLSLAANMLCLVGARWLTMIGPSMLRVVGARRLSPTYR